MSEKISITRALSEIKLLNNRISKKISENDFVYFMSKKKNINSNLLTSNAKSNYQSIIDLIHRRNKLKSAIILSNSQTKVSLNNNTMTVAEVIEMKNIIPLYKELLQKLKYNRESIMNQVERQNNSMENDLQKILEINFGKSNNLKTNSDDIETISKTYRVNNQAEMLDCIDINNKINQLEEIIQLYENESNFVLSESNAITQIEI